MVLRVMSSGVGPKPPVTIIKLDRLNATSKALRMSCSTSRQLTCHATSKCIAERRSAKNCAFVFKTLPFKSSEPIVINSQVGIMDKCSEQNICVDSSHYIIQYNSEAALQPFEL